MGVGGSNKKESNVSLIRDKLITYGKFGEISMKESRQGSCSTSN